MLYYKFQRDSYREAFRVLASTLFRWLVRRLVELSGRHALSTVTTAAISSRTIARRRLLGSRAIFRPDCLDLANLLIHQGEFLEVRDPEGETVADLFPPIFLHRLDLLLLLGVEDIPHLGQLFFHERPHFLADGFNLGLLVVGELRGRR